MQMQIEQSRVTKAKPCSAEKCHLNTIWAFGQFGDHLGATFCSHWFLAVLCQFLQRPNHEEVQVFWVLLPPLGPKHSGLQLTGVVQAETQSQILSMSAFPAATVQVVPQPPHFKKNQLQILPTLCLYHHHSYSRCQLTASQNSGCDPQANPD